MDRNAAITAFENEVNPAVFRADGSAVGGRDGACALVYPYKDGSGFLYVVMQGSILDHGSQVVREGGKLKRLRNAIRVAVERFMQTERISWDA